MKKLKAVATASLLVLGLAALPSVAKAQAPNDARIPKTHHVTIKGFKFDPEKLEVKAGDTVVWTNEDIVPHTVTAEVFKSKSLDKGESWSLKTKQKGDFPYICKFHPSMNAELIVR